MNSSSAGAGGTTGSGGTSGAGGAGYSGTPLARKLGIKAGHTLHLLHAPEGWSVPELPPSCTVAPGGPQGADVTLAFYGELAVLTAEVPSLAADLADSAILWVTWPRRATGHTSDITDNSLRELLLPLGLVDTKVAAVDEAWSGLKFVRRVANRAGK